MHGHPAAVRCRLVDDRDGAAIGQFNGERKGLALLERGAQFAVVARRIERERSRRDARVQQVADGAAVPNLVTIDIVHGPVSFVPDHETVLRIEHAQSLNHVVERAIELHILLAERASDVPA
jgi:hypothetical protein